MLYHRLLCTCTTAVHVPLLSLQVNYYPSAVSKKDRPADKSDVTESKQPISGVRTRTDYTKEQDEFRQPGERYRSFDEARCVAVCTLDVAHTVQQLVDAQAIEAWQALDNSAVCFSSAQGGFILCAGCRCRGVPEV